VTGKSLSIAKQSEMIESIQNFRFGNRFKQTEARLKDDKINAVNKHEWKLI
jgi:hypothetical protein